MSPSLHRAKFSDWENITDENRNIWQKVAYKSYGTLTPANLASLAGGFLSVYGLFIVFNGEIVSGLSLLTIGRIADLLDGMIAEYTKTKSPLGELVDAIVDKLVVAFAVIIFAVSGLVPWPIIALIAAVNIFNGLFGLLGKLKKLAMHPSKFGKYSTFLAWITLIFYPLGIWIKAFESALTGMILIGIALISFAFFVVIGLVASINYGRIVVKKK